MRHLYESRLARYALALTTASLLWMSGSVALAHFVWVDLGGQADKPVGLYFGDATVPDAARLLDNVQQTKLFVRGADGQYHQLKMEKKIDGDRGYWIAGPEGKGKVTSWNAVEAVCDYGVLDKGGEQFHLQYSAKYLNQDALASPSLTASGKLPLDIIPTLTDNQLQLEVQADGKPVAGAEVVITDEANETTTLETDAKGMVAVKDPRQVRYHIRARQIETRQGEQDGKKFDSVRNYSTLVLDLGDQSAAAKSAALGSATQLLEQSRAARAVWDDFPGFTSRFSVRVDDQTSEGTLTVDGYGKLQAEGLDLEEHRSVRSMVRSLVSHRMPGEPASEEADFDPKYAENPLGTMIRLRGDGMGSHYRLQENVVTEVNRDSNDGRFTISVLSVHRNPEGKYLPEAFTVDSWNKDGELTGSSTHFHRWVRVGDFDLPEELTVVATGDNKRTVTRLRWEDHQLLAE